MKPFIGAIIAPNQEGLSPYISEIHQKIHEESKLSILIVEGCFSIFR